MLKHNINGMPGCEVMPQLLDPSDFIVDAKKRYDCFIATDLDLSLRSHGVDTVLDHRRQYQVLRDGHIAAAACCRDYAVVVSPTASTPWTGRNCTPPRCA